MENWIYPPYFKWGDPNHGPLLIIHILRYHFIGPKACFHPNGPKTTTQLVNKCFIAHHDTTYHVTLVAMVDRNPATELHDTPAGAPIHFKMISRWSDKAGNLSGSRATYRYKAREMISANTRVNSESLHHP